MVVKGGHSGSGSPGVVTARDAKDVEALIGKPRSTASSAPGRQGTGAGRELREPTELIVQEGVLTNERVHNGVAEPVVYTMDRYVVGGFYRVHAERAADENLKLPGASFVPLAFLKVRTCHSRRQAWRQRAQPLLHVWRGRPAGHGGRQLRDGSDRSGRRNLRMIAEALAAACANHKQRQNSGLTATETKGGRVTQVD